jgi:hypothetical protein
MLYCSYTRSDMRKYIPAREVAEEWLKNPEFRAAYDALEPEFALADAFI